MGLRLPLLLSVVSLVAGCASPSAQLPPRELRALDSATAATHVPIALRQEDRTRTDAIGAMRFQLFSSGKIFAHVFSAEGGSGVPTLEIVSASTDWSITDLGFTGLHTYKVTAMLRANGEKYLLTATGVEKQHGARMPDYYAQRACERAALDLAKQAQALLR